MADGPLNQSYSGDDIISALMNQYKANQPTGPLSQIDPLWMGAAKGFLSPTKTGSFGESLGAAASGIESPLSSMRQQQMTALEKIASIQTARDRLDMMDPYWEAKTQYLLGGGSGGGGGAMSATHWANVIKTLQAQLTDPAVKRDPARQQQIYANIAKAEQHLQSAIGAESVQQTPAETTQPDNRSWWERNAPEALGGKPEPNTPAASATPAKTGATKVPKPLPAAEKKRALDAIAKGADPVAVMKMISEGGYSTEGLQ